MELLTMMASIDAAMERFLGAFWGVLTESAPWLLVGFAAAALLKVFISERWLGRQLGTPGTSSVVKAALFGAPMPLCSCGVLPVAMGLRKQKASRGATTAFLISTPETSADSVALTYALMGPLMAVIRPVTAVITAIAAGIAENIWGRDAGSTATPPAEAAAATTSSCCSSKAAAEPAEPKPASSCCSSTPAPEPKPAGSCCSSSNATAATTTKTEAEAEEPDLMTLPIGRRFVEGIRYVSMTMMRDLGGWLLLGIAIAAVIQAALPEGWLAENLGTGFGPMLLMLVVGIPLYICATASTPVAASLLLAGVSPGAILVFLLVGPATNIATMLVIYRTMGIRSLTIYLSSIAIFALAFGLGLDALLANTDWSITATTGAEHAGHDHGPAASGGDSLLGLVAPISAVILLVLLVNAYLWPRVSAWLRSNGNGGTAADAGDSCCH